MPADKPNNSKSDAVKQARSAYVNGYKELSLEQKMTIIKKARDLHQGK